MSGWDDAVNKSDCRSENAALKARVAELEHMEMFTRCQHTCATSGCTETGVSGVCGKCTVTVMHERDALAAKLAELETEIRVRANHMAAAEVVDAAVSTERDALAAKLEMEQGYVRNLQATRNDLMVCLRITIKALEEISEYPHSPTILANTARHALAKLGEKRCSTT